MRTKFGVQFILVVTVFGALVLLAIVWLNTASEYPAYFPAFGEIMTGQREIYQNDADGNSVEDYWTGDVAGLYDKGLLSREVAEADIAPLTPLIEQPKAYHGYFFVAMNTGMGTEDSRNPRRLARNTDPLEYAVCAFPEEDSSSKRTYLIHSGGVWGRTDNQGKPVREWPTDEDLKVYWARIH